MTRARRTFLCAAAACTLVVGALAGCSDESQGSKVQVAAGAAATGAPTPSGTAEPTEPTKPTETPKPTGTPEPTGTTTPTDSPKPGTGKGSDLCTVLRGPTDEALEIDPSVPFDPSAYDIKDVLASAKESIRMLEDVEVPADLEDALSTIIASSKTLVERAEKEQWDVDTYLTESMNTYADPEIMDANMKLGEYAIDHCGI